ncbi:hypothetical protein [Phaffia rhodozyma]|uniref:Uncharacterized protein n=1 Tax=Phaffia rhodozyma TaxID=264483 RepID=A0A0F7SXU1_PHARH|nr:hypothetical protein [Phaffia rhodozyma]
MSGSINISLPDYPPEFTSLRNSNSVIELPEDLISPDFRPLPPREPFPEDRWQKPIPIEPTYTRRIVNIYQDPPGWTSRLPSPMLLAVLSGIIIGARKGGRMASYRFAAENSHRKPETLNGWYFYKKQKNYYVILNTVRSAIAYAARYSAFTFTLITLEASFEKIYPTFRSWGQPPLDKSITLPPADPSAHLNGFATIDLNEKTFWTDVPFEIDGVVDRKLVFSRLASGALAGGLLVGALARWYRFHPPTIRKIIFWGTVTGISHSAAVMFIEREKAREASISSSTISSSEPAPVTSSMSTSTLPSPIPPNFESTLQSTSLAIDSSASPPSALIHKTGDTDRDFSESQLKVPSDSPDESSGEQNQTKKSWFARLKGVLRA